MFKSYTKLEMNKVLVLEKDILITELICESLAEEFGVHTTCTENLEEARRLLSQFEFDLIISNYNLADGTLSVLLNNPNISLPPIIVFSAIYDLDIKLIPPIVGVIRNKDFEQLIRIVKSHFTGTSK